MNLKKISIWVAGTLSTLIILLTILVWAMTFHPAPIQEETVTNKGNPPMLQPGQQIKIMSYNVQYMASKNYVFFYDLLDGSGPDLRPSPEDITATFHEVARVIKAEDPDIILIQEIDDGAARTDFENQLNRLLDLLPESYGSYSASYYWKSMFVPHPKIMGAVGMKVATISKYKISSATRHQLALIPADPVTQQFNLKRAIREVRLPVDGKKELVVMNTHLDAFSQGTDTMQRQVAYLHQLGKKLDEDNMAWAVGGDFNLLPPGQYEQLIPAERAYYVPDTEFKIFYQDFSVVPSLSQLQGEDRHRWFTFFPNGSRSTAPDRTIDYLIHAKSFTLIDSHIRQADTLHISDHLPVVATLKIP